MSGSTIPVTMETVAFDPLSEGMAQGLVMNITKVLYVMFVSIFVCKNHFL